MSNVTRKITVNGEKIDVELKVNHDEGTYYVIDEIYPPGMKVLSASDGGSYVADPGHIKWVVIQGAQAMTYFYTLEAGTAADNNFAGLYMFEGDVVEQQILGDSAVTIDGEAVVTEDYQQNAMVTTAAVTQQIKVTHAMRERTEGLRSDYLTGFGVLDDAHIEEAFQILEYATRAFVDGVAMCGDLLDDALEAVTVYESVATTTHDVLNSAGYARRCGDAYTRVITLRAMAELLPEVQNVREREMAA